MAVTEHRLLDLGLASEVRLRTHEIEGLIERHSAAYDQVPRVAFKEADAPVTRAATGASIIGSLRLVHDRKAHAKGREDWHERNPYGEPAATLDETTGLPLLGLPPGFRYHSFGWTGDPLFPGLTGGPATPPLHDGMGVIKQVGSFAILCRNHEAATGPAFVDGRLRYSPAAAGGSTNIMFDTHRAQWIAAWPTLSGTVRNCAGGGTAHNSWLSCEETAINTTDAAGNTYTHGWVFDVPSVGTANGRPIKAMGRRSHEAAAVDPRTGYVYLTENTTPGGVYRFKPTRTRLWEAPYSNGGKLEMLKVSARPNANLRGAFHGTAYPVPIGEPLDVDWVPINDPENRVAASNYAQGATRGGAGFSRANGVWYRDGTVFFVCADGGTKGKGQVFALDLERQTLNLIYDASGTAGSPSELDNPHNFTVTPRGSLLFCENDAGNPASTLEGESTERMVALTKNGKTFTFATNLMDFSAGKLGTYTRASGTTFEGKQRANTWAGACFDRTRRWLFVNIQTPGVTFAITGPWHRGPI